MTNKKYTLLIVGHSHVGKSSIIKRYCQEIYQNTNQPTIGTSIVLKLKEMYDIE